MNDKTKIRAGIIGAAGYTGGEIIRLLLMHPHVEISFAHSNSNAGKYIHEVHTDIYGDTDMKFTSIFESSADVLFLCAGHGEAMKFMNEQNLASHTRIIDLSQDFRWRESKWNFVYGLPELHREEIQKAQYIANPGCFATCIELALLPIASANLLKNPIHISATTGSTGAGQGLNPTSHYSWRSNNLSVYKPFEHQHLFEIGQSLVSLQKDFDQPIHFIPQRGNFTRGIFTSVYTNADISAADANELFQSFYQTHPFTFVRNGTIDLKQVVNTNKAMLRVQKFAEQLYIECIIDNLLKGASGQAVQNMNLMFGFEETSGLKLKSVVF
ncbi:MAG: N-acetyl-gamma-glutamyl-phosphate reductase [Ignavibacteriae bacterium]|nr:N-acetyl-gamma-glutamyl-phosphate reductase [Ignavibacteriota bacterium]